MMLLIKPLKGASYKNMVNALDEVLINCLSTYAVVDPSEEEIAWMKSHQDKKD